MTETGYVILSEAKDLRKGLPFHEILRPCGLRMTSLLLKAD